LEECIASIVRVDFDPEDHIASIFKVDFNPEDGSDTFL
jgi:hypothetical protein